MNYKAHTYISTYMFLWYSIVSNSLCMYTKPSMFAIFTLFHLNSQCELFKLISCLHAVCGTPQRKKIYAVHVYVHLYSFVFWYNFQTWNTYFLLWIAFFSIHKKNGKMSKNSLQFIDFSSSHVNWIVTKKNFVANIKWEWMLFIHVR